MSESWCSHSPNNVLDRVATRSQLTSRKEKAPSCCTFSRFVVLDAWLFSDDASTCTARPLSAY